LEGTGKKIEKDKKMELNDNYERKVVKMQAKAPETKPFGKEAFTPLGGTVIRWLGNAGALINSKGQR